MNTAPFSCRSFCRPATILFSVIVLLGSANAATYTVTKTDDTDDGVCNSDCSLREAITAANNQAGDDVVEFDTTFFAVARQINLIGDSLNVNNNGTLTINGTGANLLTISGSNSYRIFFINQSARATIRRVTMTNGRGYGRNFLFSGGAFYNSTLANTTLEDVIVSNSSVSSPDGGITLVGGGIYNAGTLTIRRSRIENNRVPASPPTTTSGGGGIYNGFQATLTLITSSVTNNTVEGNGGGINNNSQAALQIVNSTISGNSATGTSGIGGGLINFGDVNATHLTVAKNTATVSHGGVSTSDTTGLFSTQNSIYADNTAGALDRDFRGTMISGGYNLIENTTDTVITGTTTGNILNQDPMLRPLGNGAGGFSLYHAPEPLSPVIDKGKTLGYMTDQREKIRPYDDPQKPNAPGGDGADIGAIELQSNEFPNPAPFDFDGDRKTDVSVFHPASNSSWWIYRSSTNTTSSTVFGASSDKLVPADYTGDGKADIAVFRPSDASWYILRSDSSTFYSFPFGASDDIPAPGDFDGDGETDPAIYRPSSGAWSVLRSTDGNVTNQFFGIAEDKPAVADYDGDGKDDIAIFRSSTGAWWINRSSSGIIAIRFGEAGDKTVQDDYTGDGKADLALWRESNGFWYILRSEDYSFYGFPFGLSGDLPVPGDYDGDGKSDASIYRPSNNGWYLMRSTAGTISLQFGVANDLPIPNVYVR